MKPWYHNRVPLNALKLPDAQCIGYRFAQLTFVAYKSGETSRVTKSVSITATAQSILTWLGR